MNTRGIVNITTLIVIVAIAGCASQSPFWVAPVPATVADAPSMDPPAGPPAPTNPDPWPQKFSFAGSSGNVTLMVYQPQVERWEGNRVNFRAAVSAKTDGSTAETFGVIWATARTEINRVARMVTLEDLNLTRSNFPTLADNGASADRSTTTYNAQTGQTKTYGSGSDGGDRYASANGENYRNDGSGWQKQTSNGWQSAGGEDTSWADREQQARTQAQSRFSSFGQSGGWSSHFGGGGFRR